MKIKSLITSHMHFPKEGINFRDITPLFLHPHCVKDLVDMAVERVHASGVKLDAVAGLESRGFLLGVPLAQALNVPFIVIRKAGKLPGDKVKVSYGLEYGSAVIEVQKDQVQADWNVLVHDDLLATGGTADAAGRLLAMCSAKVAGYSFIVELDGLGGQDKIGVHSKNVQSLITYND